MGTFILLIGAPGAGKGTQAERICETRGLPHISSGDIFRQNLRDHTELGELARKYIHGGELVPDSITNAMIKERLSRPDCQAGAVLDGFPRTPAQAEALDEMLAEKGERVGAVLYVEVSEEELVRRLSGRWLCVAQDHVYHQQFNPPRKPGVCDIDGSELYQREDDKAGTVARRIRVYLDQTAPLIAYYRARGLLQEVDGEQSIEQVRRSLLEALSAKVD